ncbi:hypothetical protein [Oryzibacter oryziterrae]|uniref:hypothetical protein n=1 Tax=Oryzibacter oryziterrae TaxID=2766474 RepID=UPI001F40A968|nr:hypothetical protein [Oryzibacter oryziterrae]
MSKLFALKCICIAAMIVGFAFLLPARLFLDWYLLSDHYIRPPDANIRILVWKGYYVYVTYCMSFVRFNMPVVGFFICFLGWFFYKKLKGRT